MPKRIVTRLAAALLAAAALVPPAAAGPQEGGPPDSVEAGRAAWATYGCYQCHGYVAQGGAGPRLVGRGLTEAAFRGYLRRPTGAMPPYTEKILSDGEVAGMFRFIGSLPPPPPVESIPLLEVEE